MQIVRLWIKLDSVGLVVKASYADMRLSQIMQSVLLVELVRLWRTCGQCTLFRYALSADIANSAVVDFVRSCRTCGQSTLYRYVVSTDNTDSAVVDLA